MKKLKENRNLFFVSMIFLLFTTACSKTATQDTTSTTTGLNHPLTRNVASSQGVGSGSTFYNLSDTRDLITPFDYYNTYATQLICYRPGTGAFWILNNTAAVGATPTFVPLVQSSNGIGSAPNNYDLSDSRDKIVPYDMDGTGHLNYLICYRPGMRAFWIFKNNGGVFTCVLRSSGGVGSGSTYYDLSDSRDIIVPYDYYGTGVAKELICYRPGTGAIWIMNNTALVGSTPTFVPVFRSSNGIGTAPYNYNLNDNNDLLFPYDYNGTGIASHIVCYRPGKGTIYSFQNPGNNNFQPDGPGVSTTGLHSIAPQLNFDLSSTADKVFPFSYFSDNGKAASLLAYRPGMGACYMFEAFLTGTCWYAYSGGIGYGSAYYNLNNINDKVFPYDCDGTGKLDHLVCYRPGSGACWIFKDVTGSWIQIY